MWKFVLLFALIGVVDCKSRWKRRDPPVIPKKVLLKPCEDFLYECVETYVSDFTNTSCQQMNAVMDCLIPDLPKCDYTGYFIHNLEELPKEMANTLPNCVIENYAEIKKKLAQFKATSVQVK